ncbi:MAG: type II secretion system protein N [Legionella sp.]|nr:type II secretion system protein N [Legionella sp.]
MNFNKLFALPYTEPKKFAAIIIVIISTLLCINQLISIFHQESSPGTSPQLQNRTKEIVIDLHSALFRLPLFGEYTPPLSDADIKPSSLDVEIVGIMYSTNEEGSQVVLRAGGGDEHIYGIGDELPGGAVIKQISRNGIVVLYNGSLESVSFPENELFFEEPAKPLIGE